MAQPPLSAGLTSNSLNRIKDAGLRNREEKHVRPERCGPFHNAADEFCNQVQCTESFPLLEDGVKRRKPAPSRLQCTGTGLSASYGSLSRTAASPHLAVRGSAAGLLDRESPVLSHTIFRRPLGSRISFVCLYFAGITDYRREAGCSQAIFHKPLAQLSK